MTDQLDDDEVRALRRKARLATLEALEALGGTARRSEIREHALRHGGFGARERDAPPPAKAAHKFACRVEHELAWTLSNLKRDGLVTNPERSVWALAGAAAEPTASLAAPATASRLDELRAMPYRQYLRSPEWRETRNAALVRAGHACALDITHTDRLDVHHRTYERLGEERPGDVTVLCRTCHSHHHELVGRPRRAEPRRRSVAPPAARALYVPTGWTPPPSAERPSLLKRLLSR